LRVARVIRQSTAIEWTDKGVEQDAPLDVVVVDPGEVDVHDGRLLANKLDVLADVLERALGAGELGRQELAGLGERIREHDVRLKTGMGDVHVRRRGAPDETEPTHEWRGETYAKPEVDRARLLDFGLCKQRVVELK
jgi:hypothetical protein